MMLALTLKSHHEWVKSKKYYRSKKKKIKGEEMKTVHGDMTSKA